MLCTTSMVQEYVVYHRPVLCTTNLHGVHIFELIRWCTGQICMLVICSDYQLDSVVSLAGFVNLHCAPHLVSVSNEGVFAIKSLAQTDCMNLGTHVVTSSFKPASLTLILGKKNHAHSGFGVFFDPTVQSLTVLVKRRRHIFFLAAVYPILDCVPQLEISEFLCIWVTLVWPILHIPQSYEGMEECISRRSRNQSQRSLSFWFCDKMIKAFVAQVESSPRHGTFMHVWHKLLFTAQIMCPQNETNHIEYHSIPEFPKHGILSSNALIWEIWVLWDMSPYTIKNFEMNENANLILTENICNLIIIWKSISILVHHKWTPRCE